MKNTIQHLLLWLFLPAVLQGQILERSLISTTGNLSNTGSVYIAATLGEPVIGTAQSGSLVLTQGFQQPLLESTSAVLSTDKGDVQYTVYPNPAGEEISLCLKSGETLQLDLEIWDLYGRLQLLYPAPLKTPEATVTIGLTTLPAGTYFLLLRDRESGFAIGKTAFIKE